ncbi:MAG: ribokinase [Dysgonamonadaceae bacterium]|jgi:ribokinase|nr:ribokinase [Dysgonamonadaceae bacterium]
MSKIVVIGSSNIDLIATVKNFPAAGETIIGKSFLQAIGGKGANQAVAAHKLGGDVKFITCLGTDVDGQNTLKYFRETGLDVSSVLLVEETPSGTAIILVNENGENCIVTTPGANHLLLPDYIHKIKDDIAACDMVLLQMEIPYDTIKTVCELAHKQQKTIMLNAAPACRLDKELIKMIDVLVVNETEAETVSSGKIDEIGEKAIIDKLLELGAKTVVLTLGKQGCLLKNEKETYSIPAFCVKALDTTAAGDTFCGALAARLTRGEGWEQALKFATAASAICVSRIGAQPSIPTEKEVNEFLCKIYIA